MIFYAWGGLVNIPILAASMMGNYLFALLIDARSPPWRARMLALAVSLNIASLLAFKYTGFLAENLNALLAPLGVAVPVEPLPLPLGISFFTFHAISYLVDVYRRRVRANGRLEEIALYITMFPQLVAGPIVRYSTIAARIRNRRTTPGRVSAGLRIFIIGLSWKVLIADEMAPLAAAAFDHAAAPTFWTAWIGVQAYALQIYFDFGGYSNMAIGLALAMGLKFPRNFRTPYGARSVADFWRRWHMSLTSWFRDYLYIPLGGNRHGRWRTALNLWTVFLLCGLWHGASWNFVIWGAHHGTFLVLERTAFGRLLAAAPRAIANAYVLLAALTGWVWFRAETLDAATTLFAGLAGLNGFGPPSLSVMQALQPLTVIMTIIGWPLAVFGLPLLPRGLLPEGVRVKTYAAGDSVVTLALLLLCLVTVGAAAYSPFLYFRF